MRLLPTDFPRLTALPLALAALALAPGASAQMGKGAAGEPACHAVGVDGAPAPGACRVLVPSAFSVRATCLPFESTVKVFGNVRFIATIAPSLG